MDFGTDVLAGMRADNSRNEANLRRRKSVVCALDDLVRVFDRQEIWYDLTFVCGVLTLRIDPVRQPVADAPVLIEVDAAPEMAAPEPPPGPTPEPSPAPPVAVAVEPAAGEPGSLSGGRLFAGQIGRGTVVVAPALAPVAVRVSVPDPVQPPTYQPPSQEQPPTPGRAGGWTEAEEVRALELSGIQSTRHIARALGRTDRAIENRFWKYLIEELPMPQGWCVTADRKFARLGSANSGASMPGVVTAMQTPAQPAAQPAAVKLTAPDDLSLQIYPRPELPAPRAPAAVAQKNLPGPCFDAAPQDDLTAHLLALPRDAVWTWDRDFELCELLGLQYTISAISDDMGIKDRDIQARFDQMTGLNRDTRVRRFIRSEIIGRMALLSGLAAAVDAE